MRDKPEYCNEYAYLKLGECADYTFLNAENKEATLLVFPKFPTRRYGHILERCGVTESDIG